MPREQERGRWKEKMRAFVCNSNITYQQMPGQRYRMKMHMMDVVGGERKGGMESPGTGPAEEFKGMCVCCTQEQACPDELDLGWNPKCAP